MNKSHLGLVQAERGRDITQQTSRATDATNMVISVSTLLCRTKGQKEINRTPNDGPTTSHMNDQSNGRNRKQPFPVSSTVQPNAHPSVSCYPVVPVQVNDITTEGILDTGSWITFISHKIAKRSQLKLHEWNKEPA